MFEVSARPIDVSEARKAVRCRAAGGYVSFEGWVRDHNEGKAVVSLEYEAYAELARKEGLRILAEARDRFELEGVAAIHRVGHLQIGDLAVWVGASAAHRDAAFAACRYVIDEVKKRVPIWKCEHYEDGGEEWVACSACAHTGGHSHAR
jgi:molybdopterin synthase catalytic subunit